MLEAERLEFHFFTNSISARQWSADSHFVWMEVLSKVLDKLDMTTKEDVSQDLKPNRIMKNNGDLKEILRSIQESINSFSEKWIKIFFSI